MAGWKPAAFHTLMGIMGLDALRRPMRLHLHPLVKSHLRVLRVNDVGV